MAFQDIDSYIEQFDPAVREKLQSLRSAIREEAPEAKEAISYGMPTFKFHGNLIHFAAYRNHIGFYPAPSGINAFKEALSDYECSKGAIRFPMDRPLPLTLVRQIVQFRVRENSGKVKKK